MGQPRWGVSGQDSATQRQVPTHGVGCAGTQGTRDVLKHPACPLQSLKVFHTSHVTLASHTSWPPWSLSNGTNVHI